MKMLKLMLPIGIMCFFLVILNDWIISIWIHREIIIPPYLAMVAGMFSFINCLNNVFTIFLNGVGKIRLQMYLNIISALTVIPLSWWLMGIVDVTGMLLAMTVCMSLGTLPLGLQVRKIIRVMSM